MTGQDGTGRARLAGEELERVVREIEQVGHIGYWVMEGDDRRTSWSDEVFRIHGLEPGGELPRGADPVVVHEDDRAALALRLERAWSQGAAFDVASRILRPEGDIRAVLIRGFREERSGGSRLTGVIFDVTERQRSEARLHEETGILKGTLEAMDHGVMMVDPSGRVRLCNGRARALLDLPPGLMASQPHAREVFAFLRRHSEFEALSDDEADALCRGEPGAVEYVRPNGVVLETRTVPLQNGGHVRTFADQTKRREADLRLRSAEARYRLLAEHGTDTVVQLDPDLIRRYVSPAIRDLLGYEPEEMIGTHPLDFVHPDDREEFAGVLEDLRLRRIESSLTEQRYRRRDGTYLWVEKKARLYRDQEGRPSGFAVTIRDVDRRRAAQEALAAGEARYRLLAENASDLIVLGDAEIEPSYVSPAACSMLGYAADEVQRIGMAGLAHPDDQEALRQSYDGLSAESPNRSVMYRLRRKDGRYIWVEAALRRAKDERGQVTTVAAIRDVTDRQAQAEEVRAAKEAAEAARADAEAANEAKTEFLASMSHEIRTPLNAVIGFTDLIASSGKLPPELRRQMDTVRASGAALLTLVNDILDFSRIEAGAIELEPVPFSPVALVEGCVSMIRGTADSRRLDLRCLVAPDVPRGLVGDEARLRQVLLNLLNNAVKFTRAGSVTLSLNAAGQGPRGERLRFSVTDTGIGIAAEKQHRLFQRFSQVDGTIGREFGGTGLGLAICKRLVELMGGEIGFISEEGRGSTFWFSIVLPRGKVETRAEPAFVQALPRKRGYLLLVEDIAINQELARLVLQAGGHRVDVVGTGLEAVRAVQDRAYDLVLMDVQMPEMDGLSATRAIRALRPSGRRLPIIAMTANVLPEQIRKFREVGMDDHVAKPLNTAELYAAIDRWLDEASGQAA